MDKASLYQRVFNHFDSNGDSRICARELRQCIESIGGGGMSAEEAETAVALMDCDGDGVVGVEDLARMMEGGGEEERRRDLEEAFKMYSEGEENGVITAKSLKRMLGRLGERSWSVDECKKMICGYDLNGDGVLSFHEFRLMMMISDQTTPAPAPVRAMDG